jgi:hypothetical protein
MVRGTILVVSGTINIVTVAAPAFIHHIETIQWHSSVRDGMAT